MSPGFHPNFPLKLCFNELGPIITNLVNLSLSEGIFPSSFKQALVQPLLKNHLYPLIGVNRVSVRLLGFADSAYSAILGTRHHWRRCRVLKKYKIPSNLPDSLTFWFLICLLRSLFCSFFLILIYSEYFTKLRLHC